ncbi:ATP-binding protein [Streptomyces sp. NPDC051907]|uniref:sensor histidine kinase n=1 Tax=Streptomyces sp. NPDC051907 TaxID=3155284 RepID=UPI0034126E10
MRTSRKTPGADPTPQPPPPPASAASARGRRAHAGPPAVEHTGHEPRAEALQEAARAEAKRREAARAKAPVRGRGRLGPRTVRAKIICLLMVPVVSLLALWGFATVTTAQDVARLRSLDRVDVQVREPVVAAIAALQAERRAAVRQVASPSDERAAALQDEARRTDSAIARLWLDGDHIVGTGGDIPKGVAGRLEEFVAGAESLSALRTAVLDRTAPWNEVYARYTAAITAAFGVSGALAGMQDPGPGSDARVLLELARAGEMLAREDALLTSAHLTATLEPERQRLFTGAVSTRRSLVESAAADLRGREAAAWRELAAQSGYRRLQAAEDQVLAAPAGRRAAEAVPAAAWDGAHASVRDGLRAIETGAREAAADRTDPLTGSLLTGAGAAVLLGLAAVAASLVISVRIGRGLVVELTGLRNSALEIAGRKLPHAMRRLRTGEQIDIQAEAPKGPPAEDEIGQVGEALGTVHRAALSAAVERAELADGISGVFVNLARRSQILVHRQLTLLDTMERRADDPNELGDLFRLDHLTTRMRRHAESLIILSGAAAGRGWRMPVPLTNVVRAAVSEIEDYARVEVRQLPETAIVGAAVADVTHLLAELIENAAQFSPPHTKVRINGEPVGNGYALEIEDRGLGMGKEALVEANRRIEEAEALDLFDSDRLGLFVVSRLAARHTIKVQLRTSPYGGTTAVILLPTSLLQSALDAGASAPSSNGGFGPGEQQPTSQRPERPSHAHDMRVGPPAARRVLEAPTAGEHPGQQAREHPGRRDDDRARPHIGERAAPVGQAGSHDGDSAGRGYDGERAGHRSAQQPLRAQPPGPDRQPPPGVATLRLRGAPPMQPEDGELPRRVRQTHLVPQLREAPSTGQGDEDVTGAEDSFELTPEQARDRMTAFRDGWARGGGAAPGSARSTTAGAGSEAAPGCEGDEA